MTDVFFWSILFVLPVTMLMGASFPLISSLALNKTNQEGQTIGSILFSNIAGNVFGGIITGFILLSYIGTENTLLAFTCIGIIAAIFSARLGVVKIALKYRIALVLFSLFVIVIFFPGKGRIYQAIHRSPSLQDFKFYFEEGRDGVVMTYKKNNQIRNYINGLHHGGRPGLSFIAQAVEGVHFAKKVENVLIIGFGTGTITETILKTEGLKKIILVELNATLIKNLRKIALFKNVLNDRRIELINDDGRRYLLRSEKKFDLVLADPLRSTTSYSNNLYSHEFNKLVEQHLTPGGVFVVWMDEHRVIPKTIASAFSHVRMYNFFCLASDASFKSNDDRRTKLLDRFPLLQRKKIVKKIIYLGDQQYIQNQSDNYSINHDWRPVSEYFIGLKIKEKYWELR